MLTLDRIFHRHRKRVCVQWVGGVQEERRESGGEGEVHKDRKISDNREDFEFCSAYSVCVGRGREANSWLAT